MGRMLISNFTHQYAATKVDMITNTQPRRSGLSNAFMPLECSITRQQIPNTIIANKPIKHLTSLANFFLKWAFSDLKSVAFTDVVAISEFYLPQRLAALSIFPAN